MSVEEAKRLMVRCLKVLFYRDCRSLNRFQIGVVCLRLDLVEFLLKRFSAVIGYSSLIH